MSLGAADLGAVADLATALGLLTPGGAFQEDWLSNPGNHLSSILSDDGQRDALVKFIDTVLGGSEQSTDPDGLIWLPLLEHAAPDLKVYAVLDPQPTYIGIGIGATVTSSTSPSASVRAHVPVFRAGRGSADVPSPILLGAPGARIRASAEVTVDDGPPAAGAAHLGGVAVTVNVPTAGSDGPPILSLTLRQLQLPGAPAPRDVNLSLDNADELGDSVLELVLGLIKAQADALPGGPLDALARLTGLRGGAAIPEFPVQGLTEIGPAALAGWFEAIVSDDATRTAWLDALADLLGGGATVSGGELQTTLGTAAVRLALGVVTGSGGHPRVIPTLRVSVPSGGDLRLRAEADLLTLDLATGAAIALPRLEVHALAGRRVGADAGGSDLLTGDPACRATRIGFGLDAQRRPVFVLAADGVDIGTNHYDTLDLTNPGALADAAGAAVGDVATRLLNRLGGASAGIRALLGLDAPAGFPTIPTVSVAQLLQNPLGAVREYWRALLTDHEDAVPAALRPLRDLISDAAHAAATVTGDGTAALPWVLPLAGPVQLQVFRDGSDPAGSVHVAVAARYSLDTLGQGCTRVDSSLRVALATLDLVGGHAAFCSLVEGRLTTAASGEDFARFRVGDADLRADHIGLSGSWRPGRGLAVNVLTPNLTVAVESDETGPVTVPLVVPMIGADGSVTLPPEGWDSVERLAALLAAKSAAPWLAHLLDACGWRFDGAVPPHHLRLAELVADPPATIKAWLVEVALDGVGALDSALNALARTLSGTARSLGRVSGSGRPDDPYLLPLGPDQPATPRLAIWLVPGGPSRVLTAAGRQLRGWRPGMAGLDSTTLKQGLVDEGGVATELTDLLSGRADMAAGLDALATRWLGTDGRVVPPDSDPTGVVVHRLGDVATPGLAAVDLAGVLGHAASATVVHVAVAGPADDVAGLLFPGIPADRRIDLRAAGLAPESFAVPAAAAGDWLVLLGRRADCMLPAGDPDGVTGQAGRLRRVLDAFGPGSVTVVAGAEAGHAALRAISDQSAPVASDLVTLGTPWGPVAFTAIDDEPGADALRLLHYLLPAVDPDEPDDPDLELARGLIAGLHDLTDDDDPGRELRLPAAGIDNPAGVAVHAVFGVAGADAIARAITATFAAGLSVRAQQRTASPVPAPTGVRAAVRMELPAAATGLTAGGHALLELGGFDVGAGGVTITTALSLRARLELRRSGGWLVGGPAHGRSPGPRPNHDLRWLSCDVVVPVSGAGPAGTRLVLHEARVFGLDRERWVVSADAAVEAAAGLAGTVADTVTPVLPEVRVLVSDAAAELGAAAAESDGTPLTAVVRLLTVLELLGPDGGALPDGIDHLLHDPAAHVAAALIQRRAELEAALTAVVTGALAAPGGSAVDIDVDLAARSVTANLGATPGDVGMLPWTLQAVVSAGQRPRLSATLGSSGSTPAGGAVLRLSTEPALRLSLDWHRPGVASPQAISLWPEPDMGELLKGVARLVPTELGRIGLGYLRELDPTVTPIVDAALDAIGLLGSEGPDGRRGVLSPAGLVADPVGWFTHPASFGGSGASLSAAKVVAFLDAMKPIIGIAGGPGEWQLSTGVGVHAGTRDGNLELAMTVDTESFAPIPAAAGRLAVTVGAGLLVVPGGPPRPAITLTVGLPGGAAGVRAVHVRLDGGALSVFLRPPTGADVSLYPDPPGLGSLATEAVQQALPLILDALADLAPQAGVRGDVGSLVAAVGDLLGLRQAGDFSGAKLVAWAADPVGGFRTALLAASTPALNAVAGALNSLLAGAGNATVSGSGLAVTVKQAAVGWQPNPFAVSVGVDSDVAGIEHAAMHAVLDTSGLQAVDVTIGPAAFDVAGVTLRPRVRAVVGAAPAGGRVIELALLDGTNADSTSVAARWHLDGPGLQLVVATGAVEHSEPEQVALALVNLLIDLVAGFVLGTDAVTGVLGNAVGASTVRQVLTGPVLKAGGGAAQLADDLFDPAQMLDRLLRVAANVAQAGPSVLIDNHLRLGLTGAGGRAGVTAEIDGRVTLGGDDVTIWLEADSRWVQRPDGVTPAPGLSVFLLDTIGASPVFAVGLDIGGVGIRVGRESGPLLDIGLTLGSVAAHGYGHIGAGDSGAGVQLVLGDLTVGLGGAGDGSNPVAEGVLRDSGTGSNKLAPSFSPAVAVQKHGGGQVLVSVSAGEGAGPWWLSIQKGFGPVYIEQVGFGATVEQQQLQRISLFLDGRVSLFGLTAAVDDLQLFYLVQGGGSLVEPGNWGVDLAGFAFDAEMAGISLQGGLRKFAEGSNIEFVGMLVGRFAVYGLSLYGGYGTGAGPDGRTYASFFAFGGVNGPIGGPPAFFLTGIGGGLGINRALNIPTDMSRFGDFVFIKALDPGARPSNDPMAELQAVRDAFPMQQGEFWFAAGISFTSFALVDGVAVVSVAIGDGLQIALLGLARVALPRPQVALVSIELGLVVRFSTKEGVLWIQAQLTDNSWLLHESVRLTGGFAFVTWFKGQYAGQFVLTMGGFHPDFHRDGYPSVPRLGFRWGIGDNICIKGGAYFALTSEALMAGGRLEASAEFGPAWAHITFGADGIVYYDPFRFELDIYAHIKAGVTIDVWIGEITIEISIGAKLHLEGPKFHGKATFSIGPVGVTVPFGDRQQNQKVYLDWPGFVRKYLEDDGTGRARAISALTGRGTLAPGASGGTPDGTADGSAAKPFVVYSEFELLVTTTVPTATFVAGSQSVPHVGAMIGIAPMNVPNAGPRLTLSLVDPVGLPGVEQIGKLGLAVSKGTGFPVGVWGPPQPDDDRKVPGGNTIAAIDGATFTATATLQGTLPTPVNYYQVEVGARKPLPFVPEGSQRLAFINDAKTLGKFVVDVPAGQEIATAERWLAGGGASRLAVASFERDRTAPPLLGSLSEGFLPQVVDPVPTQVVAAKPPVPADLSVHPPRAIGLLAGQLAAPPAVAHRTTVSVAAAVPRTVPPDLLAARARTDGSVPVRLIRQPRGAFQTRGTVIASGTAPLTRMARGSVAQVSGRSAPSDAKRRLADLTVALAPRSGPARAAAPGAQVLRPGDLAVLQLPNAGFDTDRNAVRPRIAVAGGQGRVLAIGPGGRVLDDRRGVAEGSAVPIGTERLVVLAGAPGTGVAGWHSGQDLAYVGWATAVVAGATVFAEGSRIERSRDRYRTGWVPGAELVDAATIVTTRFDEAVRAVAVLIDDPLGTEAARGLVLSLDGARRPVGPDGEPVPPTIVALGNRSALVYALLPDVARRAARAVSVGVASQAGWHLAGVVGLTAAAEVNAVGELVDRLGRGGIDAVVRPLVDEQASGEGCAIRWVAAQRQDHL